jgi:hypothetical protein
LLSAAIIVAFAVVVGGERLGHRAVHSLSGGADQFSVLLFARSLLLNDSRAPEDTVYPVLSCVLKRDLTPVYAVIDDTRDIRIRQFLLTLYGSLGHFTYRPEVLSAIRARTGASTGTIFRTAALDRIYANKTQFLRVAFENFVSLWTIYRVSTPAGAKALQILSMRTDPCRGSVTCLS